MNTCLKYKHILMLIAILFIHIHTTEAQAQNDQDYYERLGEFKYSLYDNFESLHRSPAHIKKIITMNFLSSNTYHINQLKYNIVFTSALLSSELEKKMTESLILPISAEPMRFVTTFKETSKRLTLNDEIISDIYLSKIKYWDDSRIQGINPSVRLKRQIIYPHVTQISADLSAPKVFMSIDFASPFFLYDYLTKVKPLLKRVRRMQMEQLWTTSSSYICLTARAREPLDCYDSLYLIPEHILQSIESLPLKQDPLKYYSHWNSIPDSARSAKAVLLQNRSGVSIDVNEASVAATISADMNALKQNHIHYSINVPASGGYPLISYHYVIIPKKMRGKAEIADLAKFVHWLFNEGKATALKKGYYPLTPELQQWVENKIAELKNK